MFTSPVHNSARPLKRQTPACWLEVPIPNPGSLSSCLLCLSLQSLPAGVPFGLCIPLVADHHIASVVSSPQTKSIIPGATWLWLSILLACSG